MTTRYEVEVNKEQMQSAIDAFEFVGGNTSDAIRIAINKAAPKIKTLASRAIREQVRLRAVYVGARLTLTKATKSRLSAAIGTPSRGTLMTRYSTDNTVALGVDRFNWISPPPIPANGIKIAIKQSGGAKNAPRFSGNKPFYMVLKKSHALGIVARLSTPGKQGGRFKVFNSPSISQVFNTVRDDILPAAGQEFQAQLIDAMRYILVKKHPPEATA